MTKSALITAQDGSYLAELLLEKGYDISRLKSIGWIPDVELSDGLRKMIDFI